MSERKRVGEFELVDHGVEHEQYFQGCGTSFTKYEFCATGCGYDPAEALDDLLEMISQNSFDTEGLEERILQDVGVKQIPNKPKATGEEQQYYISLRWNNEDSPAPKPPEPIRIEDLWPGVRITIRPCGADELWIQNERGDGFRLSRCGDGKAGFGLTIGKFVGGRPISITGNKDGDYEVIEMIDANEISLCQYKPDARSQAYKAWYTGKGSYPKDETLEQ